MKLWNVFTSTCVLCCTEGWVCDEACVLSDGKGRSICYKPQKNTKRIVWASIKFMRENPLVAGLLAELTSPPVGKWHWAPTKKAFRKLAEKRIAAKRQQELFVFVADAEVGGEDVVCCVVSDRGSCKIEIHTCFIYVCLFHDW